MVGLSAAAVVAGALDTPSTTQLWLGAFVASGVPDLDVVQGWFGLKGPAYHRNRSHSLFVLVAVSAIVWLTLDVLSVPVGPGVRWGWIAALFTHPLVDLATTGPVGGGRGYGVSLFWPFSTRRWFLARPLLETADFGAWRNIRDVWVGIQPEIFRLGPVALLLVAIALLV